MVPVEERVLVDEGPNLVIWASRHPPVERQLAELRRIYGGVRVVQLAGVIPSAEWLDARARELGARAVVPVLPLSFIARLAELARGYDLLWAEMEAVKVLTEEPRPGADYDPSTEVYIKGYEGSYRIMRFKGFKRIKAVKLELEEV